MKIDYLDQFTERMKILLKGKSFKKKNLNWIQETSKVYKILNIQKSQWGKQIYINWGIFIKQLLSKAPRSCLGSHIGGRFDHLIGSKILNFENDMMMENRLEALEKLISSDPYNLFSIEGSDSELIKLIQDSGTKIITVTAKVYLRL